MHENPLRKLHALGQSIWLDYIRRDLISGGGLRRLIEEDGLRGITSNPAIFESSITGSRDYDEDILAMALEGKGVMAVYEALSQRDVQAAADEFRPLYDSTDTADGFVSLEVNPHLAHDTHGTIEEARRLWAALNRPNVFIKVPATTAGLPAIRQLIGEGINVNVTLLFGLPRYRQVAEAYIAGLEARAAQGKPLWHVASVASFFVSRIDQSVDPLLETCIAQGGKLAESARNARGQVAIASAKGAYQIYREIFGGNRFLSLAGKNARAQRPLWASTSTKNPGYEDIKYVEALIGADTVNTLPLETLDAYRDHGHPRARIEDDLEEARLLLARLPLLGIDIDDVTQQLEHEGVEKFTAPFDKLLATLETAPHSTRGIAMNKPLSASALQKMHAYWRAANYLSVGQIYLFDNPLLKAPLAIEHVKPRLLGHWGTTPGLNFIYVHLNRVIVQNDLNMMYVTGPGHGGPALVANTYLEGTYSEVYPEVSQDERGMQRLFRQFSFPGGVPSHVSAEVPGSINEGGELGYSLMHAYGAAFDNPDLIVACVVGDGEAETGPLAASWHSNKFLNPARDGAVLPILHLNGFKIASPAVLARVSHEELDQLFRGYGHEPHFVEGEEPDEVHQAMAATLDRVIDSIRSIQSDARSKPGSKRPMWPMIILRTPKGWTGPKTVDGLRTEGSWRSHQVPLANLADKPEHLEILEQWLKSYRPEELFDASGKLMPELAELAPKGVRRMGANPHANGGALLRDLRMPAFRDYAVDVPSPGAVTREATRVTGAFLRDVMKLNMAERNFRVFGPDETESNRLGNLFEVTDRVFMGELTPSDTQISPEGRVMEVLSEHLCQGWLEGYLLTGRHGFFSCYEAFIHIVDSMFNQHAKWLKVTRGLAWRRPIASLNYLLTSHVWRQDHNGFSHQDPGFIDHVVNKKADVIRVYLPPDANTLLSVTDHCLRSRHYVNVIVAGKQPAPQWLDMDAAVKHCTVGLGIWHWASSDEGGEPDVVMACAGDVPTLETLAAVHMLREHLPELKIRVVNVVDLMALQSESEHPHGLNDKDFDVLFTRDKPIIFAYHGYPSLIHQLTYRRTNHANLHVHGYKEEGTTTTPFDMVVLNEIDRFHLLMDVVNRVPGLPPRAADLRQLVRDKLIEHKRYIERYGEDMPEIRDWRWAGAKHGGTS